MKKRPFYFPVKGDFFFQFLYPRQISRQVPAVVELTPRGSLYLSYAEEGLPMISSSFSWTFIPGGCDSCGPSSKPSCRNFSNFVLWCFCHRFVSRSEQRLLIWSLSRSVEAFLVQITSKLGKCSWCTGRVQNREAERKEWKLVHQRKNFLLQTGK